MSRKSWFQHDFNAHLKDGLSRLLQYPEPQGTSLYGKFWLLQEHFYLAQQDKSKLVNIIKFAESRLCNLLKTNRRRLPKILDIFHNCLDIECQRFDKGLSKVCQRFDKGLSNVYKVTMPNALIFIEKRGLKILSMKTELERELNKETNKEKSAPSKKNNKKKKPPAFIIDCQPVAGSDWGAVVKACKGNTIEAAKIMYRARGKRKIVAWIRAGIKRGYAFKHCLDEDRCPAQVIAWCDQFILKIGKQDTRKAGHRSEPEAVGDIIKF